ncbi:AarF/UbiB family protein [Prosthecobacter sp.]|uniref:ABC1 kinase family protein n=1 Tax=Prosthecobacter sp. TaxID=1965333 RepID=UPI002489B253|nr:AarF/UbiB family protein [Prosthecobacter sp.]MDI1312272.1 AarF/UbiB family protein [Prosthecobacter sp.]
MSLSLKPANLKRYRDLLMLFYKYGHGDLVKNAPVIDDPLPHAQTPPMPLEARALADDIEKLGPTYIKLAQLLSTRSDFVPQGYMDALSRLQDHVEPFSFEQVQAIVSMEIGARLSKAFIEFDPTPIAAASLGQVHRAVLRGGQQVVVKVQRPEARQNVSEDLEAMTELAAFMDAHTDLGRRYGLVQIVEELRKSLLRELDYRLEAMNLLLMRKHLGAYEHILVPAPVEDYSSGRVLTMEHVTGQKITKFSPLIRVEIDGDALAEELFQAYLHQILMVGVFHADPHPGNIFLTDDRRIALLDLGMVGRVGNNMQDLLLKLLLGISEGNGDQAAAVAEKMGEPDKDYDALTFKRRIADLVSQQRSANLNDLQIGKVVLEVQKIAGDCHLRVPPEFTLLGKTLLNLDLVGRTLSPTFDPNESVRRNSAKIMHEQALKSFSSGNLFGLMLEAKEFLEKLPSRLNQFMDLVSTNKLRVKVDTFNENLIITSLQKIANRITLGLILASLIIGAALLMRVDTPFRIFGYPGVAMLCFFLAASGGLALAWQIVRSDQSDR